MPPHVGEPGSDSLPFLAVDRSLYQQQKACPSLESCDVLEQGSASRPSPYAPSGFSLHSCSHCFLGFAQPTGPKAGESVLLDRRGPHHRGVEGRTRCPLSGSMRLLPCLLHYPNVPCHRRGAARDTSLGSS